MEQTETNTNINLTLPVWFYTALLVGLMWCFYQLGVWWMITYIVLSVLFAFVKAAEERDDS